MTQLLVKSLVATALAASLTGCFDSDDNDKVTPEVNTPPVAVDESVTTEADIAVEGSLSASDEEGDTLTFSLDTDGDLGSATVMNDGSFTYTPRAQVTGTDSFSFSVSDGVNSPVTGVVSVTIEAQVVSLTSYTRAAFNQQSTDTPLPVNGREFTQDATEASFDDLLIDN